MLKRRDMLQNDTRPSTTEEDKIYQVETLADLTGIWDGNLGPMPWDDSDPFFSAQTRDLFQTVLKCYVRQCIVFLGFPGNVISCVVFFKHGLRRDRITLLLFSLAVADLVSLTGQVLVLPTCYLPDPLQVANWQTVSNIKIASVNLWSSFVSGTLIVVVSVDRCLSVALPLKARRFLTYRAMVVAILLSYLLPLGFFTPYFLVFTVEWRWDPSTNSTIASIGTASWFLANSRLVVKVVNSYAVITKPVFLVVVAISCVITVVTLGRASRKRLTMVAGTAKEQRDTGESRRITKMLLFLCFMYSVLVLPEMCSAVTVHFVPDYFMFKKYHNTMIVVYQFLWIASCLNSAVNFFAYLLLSSRFRSTLKELIFCCRRKG